jgi:predicted acylesterase/phospholipase RssA
MSQKSSSHFALVLPGAVARGAYEAGVIEVLAKQDTRIDRIVATSSGALNGLAFAVGIRSGREKEMAEKLTASWIEHGGWQDSFSLNPFNFLRGQGLSSSAGLLRMMRELIEPCKESKKRDVELRILVTPLNGVKGHIGKKTATTYEQVIKFSGPDFDTQEGLDRVFNVVTAACAFPGLFQPVDVPGLGACVDGGAVNNAPIKYALEESDVNRVLMPVPFPHVMKPGDWKSGLSLLNHLIAILINERLYRDLKDAQSINLEADKLNAMLKEGFLTEEQLEKIKSILFIRNVEVTEIRPTKDLKISPFSGFFKKQDRINLIRAGREAAEEMLARVPLHNPEGVQTT